MHVRLLPRVDIRDCVIAITMVAVAIVMSIDSFVCIIIIMVGIYVALWPALSLYSIVQ